MKYNQNRLRFVHCEHLFNNFTEIYNYVNRNRLDRPTLYAEPMVFKYGNEKDPCIVLAIGSVGDGIGSTTDRVYFIDFSKVEEDVAKAVEIAGASAEEIKRIRTIVTNIGEGCGFNEKGEYIPYINDKILSKATSLNVADKILSEYILALEKKHTLNKVDTKSIDINLKKENTGVTLSADVNLGTKIFDGKFLDNILVEQEDGIFSNVDLEYLSDDSKLLFTINGDRKKEIPLPEESHLVNGEYDPITENLVLQLSKKIEIDGALTDKISISMGKLIDEWGVLGEASETPIVLTKEELKSKSKEHDGFYDFKDVLKADVRILDNNALPTNILKKSSKGRYLYVDGSASNITYTDGTKKISVQEALDNKLNKVEFSKHSDNIVTLKEDGLYAFVDVKYDRMTNELIFSRTNPKGEVKEDKFELTTFEFIKDAYYDPSTEEIVIVYQVNEDVRELRIPMEIMINSFDVDNTDTTVTLTKLVNETGTDYLKADVNISSNSENILEDNGHALFVRGTADNINYKDKTTVFDALELLNAPDDVEGSVRTLIKHEKEERVKTDDELRVNLNLEINRAKEAEKSNFDRIVASERNIKEISGNVTTNSNDISNLKVSVGKLDDDIKETNNNVGIHETRLTDAEADIDSLSGYIETNIDNINKVTTASTVTKDKLDVVSGDLITLTSEVNTNKTNINTLDKTLSATNLSLSNLQSDVTNLTSVVDGNRNKIAEAEGRLDLHDDDIALLKESTKTNATNIASNVKSINSINTKLETSGITIGNKFNTLEGKVNTNTSDILEHTANLNTNNKDIEVLKTCVNTLTNNVNDIKLVKREDNTLAYDLLIGGDENPHGTIVIPKDKFLESAEYDDVHKILKFVFVTDGDVNTVVDIPIGDLVDTYTAGVGLKVENNVFSVVKSADSEEYLIVDEAGVKIVGINAKFAELNRKIDDNKTFVENNYVSNDALDTHSIEEQKVVDQKILKAKREISDDFVSNEELTAHTEAQQNWANSTFIDGKELLDNTNSIKEFVSNNYIDNTENKKNVDELKKWTEDNFTNNLELDTAIDNLRNDVSDKYVDNEEIKTHISDVKNWVDGKLYISKGDLEKNNIAEREYANEKFVDEKELSDKKYVTESTMQTNLSLNETNLKKWVEEKKYISGVPESYVTDIELETALGKERTSIEEKYVNNDELAAKKYVSEDVLASKGYLTEHQDISNLATKDFVNNGLDLKENIITTLDTNTVSLIAQSNESGNKTLKANVKLDSKTDGGNMIKLTSDGIYTNFDVTYNPTDGKLKVFKNNVLVNEYNLTQTSLVSDATYNPKTGTLDLTIKLSDGTTKVESIPIANVVADNKQGSPVTLEIDNVSVAGTQKISAKLAISTDVNNALNPNADELFVSKDLKDHVGTYRKNTTNGQVILNTISNEIDTATTNLASANKAIETLTSDLTKLDGKVTKIDERVITNTDNINTLSGTVNVIKETVNTLSEGYSDVVTNITNITEQVMDIRKIVDEMSQKINDIELIGYQYIGVADPTTTPISSIQKICYLATSAGNYANFSNIYVDEGETVMFKWGGKEDMHWTKELIGCPTISMFNKVYDAVFPIVLTLDCTPTLIDKNVSQTADISLTWSAKIDGVNMTKEESVVSNITYDGGRKVIQLTDFDNKVVKVNGIKNDTTFILNFKGKTSTIKSLEKTVSFVNRKYFGLIDDSFTISEENITKLVQQELTDSNYLETTFTQSPTKDGSGKRNCYAYPKSMHDLVSIKDSHGHEFINSYVKNEVMVNGEMYNVYILESPSIVTDYTLTFK